MIAEGTSHRRRCLKDHSALRDKWSDAQVFRHYNDVTGGNATQAAATAAVAAAQQQRCCISSSVSSHADLEWMLADGVGVDLARDPRLAHFFIRQKWAGSSNSSRSSRSSRGYLGHSAAAA